MRTMEQRFKEILLQDEIEQAKILQVGILIMCDGDDHHIRELDALINDFVGIEQPPALHIMDIYNKAVKPYEIYMEE